MLNEKRRSQFSRAPRELLLHLVEKAEDEYALYSGAELIEINNFPGDGLDRCLLFPPSSHLLCLDWSGSVPWQDKSYSWRLRESYSPSGSRAPPWSPPRCGHRRTRPPAPPGCRGRPLHQPPVRVSRLHYVLPFSSFIITVITAP